MVLDSFWEERAKKFADKFSDELCPHMRDLIIHCEMVGVVFGGCGDCGSAWLECKMCNKTVDEAHLTFERKTGRWPA